MFSIYHIIWLLISAVSIPLLALWLIKWHPLKLDTFLLVFAFILLGFQLMGAYFAIEYLPYAEGTPKEGYYAPFLELSEFPLNLCSLVFLCFFIARFTSKPKVKKAILAYCYPTCIVGPIFAIVLPYIYGGRITPEQSFTSPVAYELFLNHIVIMACGIYLAFNREVNFRFKDCVPAFSILVVLGNLSVYVNSMLAAVQRDQHGKPTAIIHATNYFVTSDLPFSGLILTKRWQWLLYFLILLSMCVGIVTLFYLPFLFREKKDRKSISGQEQKE